MKRAIIIGGGPSIKEGIEKGLWDKIGNKEIWATNYQFLTLPYVPNLLIWNDFPFWTTVFYDWFKNGEYDEPEYEIKIRSLIKYAWEGKVKLIGGVRNHNAKKPEINSDTSNLEVPIEYIYALTGVTPYFVPTERKEPKEAKVSERKLGYLPRGKNGLVGTMALSYAKLKEYDEVFILGYDLGIPGEEKDYKEPKRRQEDKETHYHNIDHLGQGNTDTYYLDGSLQETRKDYDEMFSDTDMKIWNVSPNSNIETFEKINYDEFFKKL